MNITMIGAGEFGGALGLILENNGHGVLYYDKKFGLDVSLEEAVEEAEAIVIAVPSGALAELAAALPVAARKQPVILASKGLLDLEYFGDFERFSVLSGPAFAVDIAEGRPVTMVATDALARDLFASDQVSIQMTDDPLGVLLCGSLKNVYAIGAGLFGTGEGYVERALFEMKQYLADHGARAETADLACGVGDLAMTAQDEKSRNLRFGQAMAAGASLEEAIGELGTVEGVYTLREMGRVGYELLGRVYDGIFGK